VIDGQIKLEHGRMPHFLVLPARVQYHRVLTLQVSLKRVKSEYESASQKENENKGRGQLKP
jgi:hypothetical protein